MILYCTDDHCSLPMHILIADLVDSQGEGRGGEGGGEYLIKTLNRIGMCASSDTLSKLVNEILKSQEGKHHASTFLIPNFYLKFGRHYIEL